MGMNLPSAGGEDQAVSTINTTPLVDVMQVLLIIFLITIPVVNFSVPVALPKLRNQVRESTPKDIVISVDKDGNIYWNDKAIPDAAALLERMKEVAVKDPQPEVHIRGDANTRYEFVGKVVFAAQRAGIVKVGFITEPPPRG